MNKYLKISALIIFMLIYSIGLIYPQNEQFNFRHLTTEDGLPSNYTWSIMQDSKGYMWFTTRAGLCRYDGYNVKVFQYDPVDTTSPSSMYVKSTLTEDTNGFIWFGSTNGLNKFDPITEKFTRYYKNPNDPHSIRGNYNRITYLDRQGTVWIGADSQGLNRYNPETDNFDSFMPSPDFSFSSGIRGVYEDSSGILWVGTANGLYQFDRETEEFLLIKVVKKKGERIANRFTTITEDNEGNIWYCADRIYTYNKHTKIFSLFTGFSVENTGNPNPKYMTIFLDKHSENQTLWIARDGLYKYDLLHGKLTTIYNDPSDWASFVGINPRDLYLDPTGLMWIATISGISILDPRSGQIQSHPEFAEKFQLDAVSFLKDSRGNFWIGGDNGLLHCDVDMRLYHWYKPMKENKKSFNGVVGKIVEDSENNIWIVCLEDGVYMLDREKNEFIRCKFLKYGKDVRPNLFYDIYEDAQGTLWVASTGLFKRLKNSPEPTSFHQDTSNNRIMYSTYTCMQEDQSGNLWIASLSGVLLRQPQSYRGTDNFFEYTHDPDDPNSISNSHCWSVYVDDKGEVWVGTNHGLNRYIPEKDCFERFLLDAKPAASFIYDIKSDRYGCLWMTTEIGLIAFDPSIDRKSSSKKSQVKQYLPFNQAYRSQMYNDQEGIIYIGSDIGTRNGYFSFHPDDITENRNIPPIAITSFTVRNKTVELDTAISLKRHLTLRYDENYLSFEFAALDYTKPDQNQYAYLLEGLDEDWIYSGNRRFANYTGVPPGDYTFMVKGSNNDGYWNEAGTSIAVTILPPPWKTWWAYTLYAILLMGIIYFWRRYDLKRQRLKQELELEHVQTEKLEELDKMKSRFFANISHEFRTPLTLILGPLQKHLPEFKEQELKKDLTIIQRNAQSLQRLINQLLTLSKLESGKMKLEAGEENIVKLVREYAQSFDSLATQRGIELIFSCDEEVIPVYVDRDKLEKILYNLLSNAFKFTAEGGTIKIEVFSPQAPAHRFDTHITNQDLPVTVSVSDTGQGIPPDQLSHIFDRFYQAKDSYTREQEGSGIGMALTKELVELHHGKITVESEVGKGTTFTVIFPLGKEHLKEEEIIQSTEVRTQYTEISYPLSNIMDLGINHEHVTTRIQDEKKKDLPLLLIVEDNADHRSYIQSYLIESYQIVEAFNGKKGFEKALEQIPDLVLSDVMMPEMDGFELCGKLKADPLTCHIPVILLTARDSSESKIEGLETGADDYMAKPFEPKELQARIRNLIEQRRRLREKFSADLLEANKEPLMNIPLTGMGEMDKTFILHALEIVEQQMSETDFDVAGFSKEMSLSRQQLFRKLKALTGLSPSDFIRTIRLNKAASFLANRSGTVSEIAFEVGFGTLSYFTKSFLEQFGVTPSKYMEQHS